MFGHHRRVNQDGATATALLPGDTDILDIELAVWERTMTVTLRVNIDDGTVLR